LSPDETQPIDEVPPAMQADGDVGEPREEELRAAYEAELSRLTTTDVMAQAVVSLLNLGARRLAPVAGAGQAGPPGGEAQAPHPERDIEQARDAIDAVRALLEIIERRIPSRELGPLRDALSRLQMAYAQEVGPGAPVPGAQPGGVGSGGPGESGGPAGSGGPSGGAGPSPAGPDGQEQGPPGPGPAESSGRLWVPGR
jgi:hypothetical protein